MTDPRAEDLDLPEAPIPVSLLTGFLGSGKTTGLTDPAPILHTLMTDTLLVNWIRLDAVTATVDALADRPGAWAGVIPRQWTLL